MPDITRQINMIRLSYMLRLPILESFENDVRAIGKQMLEEKRLKEEAESERK